MLARGGLIHWPFGMSTDLPGPPRTKLFGAILSDMAEYVGVSNTYDALRQDFAEMRKAWKTLLALGLLVAGAIWYFAYGHYSSRIEDETLELKEDYDRKVGSRNREAEKLRHEATALRAERDKAQLELAPWKERAQKEFPFDDVTLALAKLDAKTETVLAMFRSSIVNPLNEPIVSASCFITLYTDQDTGDGGGHMGNGAYAAFGAGGVALLSAVVREHVTKPNGIFEFRAMAGVSDPLIDKPVHSITSATFIQINVAKGAFKDAPQISGGVVVWVINNRISLRYGIPKQKAELIDDKNYKILVPDLRAGLLQLEEIARQQGARSITPPASSPNPPLDTLPQSSKHVP